jgi:hypothetical protein
MASRLITKKCIHPLVTKSSKAYQTIQGVSTLDVCALTNENVHRISKGFLVIEIESSMELAQPAIGRGFEARKSIFCSRNLFPRFYVNISHPPSLLFTQSPLAKTFLCFEAFERLVV